LPMDVMMKCARTVQYTGFSENHGGPCGISSHETDWLTLENALPRASSSRRRIER